MYNFIIFYKYEIIWYAGWMNIIGHAFKNNLTIINLLTFCMTKLRFVPRKVLGRSETNATSPFLKIFLPALGLPSWKTLFYDITINVHRFFKNQYNHPTVLCKGAKTMIWGQRNTICGKMCLKIISFVTVTYTLYYCTVTVL